jgi:hypothetical protein
VHIHRPVANGKIGLFEAFRECLGKAILNDTVTAGYPCPEAMDNTKTFS